jgi:hypothetical protein
MTFLSTTTPYYGGKQLPNPVKGRKGTTTPPTTVPANDLVGQTLYTNKTTGVVYMLTSKSPVTWTPLSAGASASSAGTTVAMAANVNYITTAATAATYTLPTTTNVGDTFSLTGFGAGGWSITYGTGQTIHQAASSTTTTTGNIASAASDHFDSVTMICVKANTDFVVTASEGVLVLT